LTLNNFWLSPLLACEPIAFSFVPRPMAFYDRVGVYGVIADSVNMKIQEIGIRMALGAARPDVFRMVIQEALIIAGAGIAAGLIGALALTRLISALLYEVKPWDPLTFAAVSVFLAAVAIAATCFPAFRATRVDPLVALRWE
jgi:putative ABC transport system permease protein